MNGITIRAFNVVCGRITLVCSAARQAVCQSQVCCEAEQRVLAEEYASWVARLAVLLASRRPRHGFHVLLTVAVRKRSLAFCLCSLRMRAWGGIGFERMGTCLRGKVTRFSLCEIQRLCKAVSVSVADSSSASMSATFIIAGRLLASIMTEV